MLFYSHAFLVDQLLYCYWKKIPVNRIVLFYIMCFVFIFRWRNWDDPNGCALWARRFKHETRPRTLTHWDDPCSKSDTRNIWFPFLPVTQTSYNNQDKKIMIRSYQTITTFITAQCSKKRIGQNKRQGSHIWFKIDFYLIVLLFSNQKPHPNYNLSLFCD